MLGSILFFEACKKDKDNNNVTPGTTMNNMGDFVKKHGVPRQTFSFNTSELPKTFTLAQGTKITIQANSLMMNGAPVTGDLKLNAYEIMKRSDAVYTGTNTNHVSGAPLISDGFFFLDITKDGISIDKNLAIPYNVQMPTPREGEFTNLWVGETDLNGTGQMGWALPLNGGVDSIKAVDSVFNFSMRDLGWVNCDVFYASSNPRTTVTVTLTNNPGALASFMGGGGETFVFFCAQGENVVAQIYTPVGTNGVKSYDNSMPIGTSGRLLAFCIKDGKFHLAKQDVTITANLSATLNMEETTEANIQAEIDALDGY